MDKETKEKIKQLEKKIADLEERIKQIEQWPIETADELRRLGAIL